MERTYTAEVLIDAPVERVWEVLTDLSAYPEWNPFTPTVRTSGRIGDRVWLHTQLGWVRVVAVERLRVWDREGGRLVWGFDLPLGVISAERVQTLVVVDGGVRYRTEDRILGWLAPVVEWLFGGALRAGFGAMAAALGRRCAGAGAVDSV